MRRIASYTEPRRSGLPFGAALAVVLVTWACREPYRLAATFCDDWCRATLRAGCDDEPDNCVRECELTKASEDCLASQRRLLACYEEARDSDFVCAGSGFGNATRVKPEVCRAERDALYECEAPGIGICLDLCREQQELQLARAYDSETGLVSYAQLVTDAGVVPACPALDQPCEALCFSVFGFESEALTSALEGGEANWPDAGASDPEEVRACLEEALLGCFVPSGAETETPAPKRRRVRSIEDVIVDCTGFR